jgi:uncharacterized membrane protein SpoIIM required for sporulation
MTGPPSERGSDREAFLRERRDRWAALEALVGRGPRTGSEWAELASGYRAVCADLARARVLVQPEEVERYLEQLAGRAHNALYGGHGAERPGVIRLLAVDFPAALRSNLGYFGLSSLFFYGPLVLGLLTSLADPRYAAGVLPEAQLVQMEEMYTGEIQRQSWQDASMAGYYVMNNIGIAFRCFATGGLFGLGSVWYLVYNGLVIGTTFGYLLAVGRGTQLLTFAVSHAPWELTGIVVAGAAGLKLGWSLVDTGGRSRLASVRAAAPALYRLVAGATAMLGVAAATEGFWSASPMPLPAKVAFGAFSAVVIAGWLTLGGRR